MKRNTIRWRIFKYNILAIMILILLTMVIFNIAVRYYMEKDIISQLDNIASHTEDTLIVEGPDFFHGPDGLLPPPNENLGQKPSKENDLFRFYFMLDRSLRDNLSVLNADYVLIDTKENIITSPTEKFSSISQVFLKRLKEEFNLSKNGEIEKYINFSSENQKYIAIIKPVAGKNSFGLGWILIYSNLQKINQLQLGINVILFIIILIAAIILALFSSFAAKRISKPFTTLNEHLGAIAERKFGNKLHVKVDDELKEFVSNINLISEKLEIYDMAQKTFLQNASHEFRTPLMSIQSYAEGIKYKVVDSDVAADVILEETKRMTNLITDLLYLSRLDAIEEKYRFYNISTAELIRNCKSRVDGIAIKNNIEIVVRSERGSEDEDEDEDVKINVDDEKLSKAITNIMNNCIRYAKEKVEIVVKTSNDKVIITICDDGGGFKQDELPYIFDRFYKGAKGNFGLGLAISKNIIEKHNGRISAYNAKNSVGAVFVVELPKAQCS